jgi:hypothetical protein
MLSANFILERSARREPLILARRSLSKKLAVWRTEMAEHETIATGGGDSGAGFFTPNAPGPSVTIEAPAVQVPAPAN